MNDISASSEQTAQDAAGYLLDPNRAQLVLLTSLEDYCQEGHRMQHALGHMYEQLQVKQVRVYSLRYRDEPVLTLSVLPDNICRHIVGLRNRRPTADELQLVQALLAPLGIQAQYDPQTYC